MWAVGESANVGEREHSDMKGYGRIMKQEGLSGVWGWEDRLEEKK